MTDQDADEIDGGVLGEKKRTSEEITAEWLAALNEIGLSPVELADYMKKQGGDYRPYTTIYRGIQRMISGESRVSGEMFVVARMLLRQHRRLKIRYGDIQWTQHKTGTFESNLDNYTVWLSPQTKGRFLVSCRAPDGYSPEFGRWQDNVTAAKNKAITIVEEGISDAAYNIREYDLWEARSKALT